MSQSRRLAAIMFVDIEGFTALMGADEAQAVQLRDKLKNKLAEETRLHGGRIIKFSGDGALCSFESAGECVRASIAIQLNMLEKPNVPVRIGIHQADVVFEEEEVHGDGVNIASRIESFAIAGGIFMSAKVYDDIKNQKDIQTTSLGKYLLKNVREPVELFAVSNPGIKIPLTDNLKGKGKKVEHKCILVLPFVNMSNDSEQEYFSDGLTEELISSLGRMKNVRVISRTTSMKYKGTKKDIKTIGIENEASYIVEGSVRKHENNLRITAQFLDANLDVQLWTETYRGTMDDIFDIQERVAVKIVEALRIQLTGDERNTLHKRYTENTEAYQLYLQGRYFWNKRNEKGLTAALRYFEKAIEKDPDYALAWAGVADTYSLMGEYTNISRKVLFPKQMAAVNRALEIDNQLAEAHIALAISLMLKEWDWDNAAKEFRIGIELNPNYATGHHWYAELLLFMGNIAEAHQEIQLAVELDPVSVGILKDNGIFYYYTRQYDEAINMGIKTLELDPDFVPAHRLLSLAYEGKGMFENSIAENQLWRKCTGNEVKADIALAYIYAVSKQKEDARKIIDEAELNLTLTTNDYRSVALVYTALGEVDLAFEWLDKSYELHEESLCSLKIDPKMDPLRSDPRFNRLLKKMGLEK